MIVTERQQRTGEHVTPAWTTDRGDRGKAQLSLEVFGFDRRDPSARVAVELEASQDGKEWVSAGGFTAAGTDKQPREGFPSTGPAMRIPLRDEHRDWAGWQFRARVRSDRPIDYAVNYELKQPVRPAAEDVVRLLAVSFVKSTTSAEGSLVASLSTAAFSGSTTAGNTLVATSCVYDPDAAPPAAFTVSDSKTNTWASVTHATWGTECRMAMHYANNIANAGTSHTITCSPGDTGLYMTVGGIELSGVDGTTPTAGSNSATGTSNNWAVGFTPTANGVVIAMGSYDGSGATVTEEGSPWSPVYEIDENGDAMCQNVMRNAAVSGVADTANWTQSGGSNNQWACIACVFREGSAPPATAVNKVNAVPSGVTKFSGMKAR